MYNKKRHCLRGNVWLEPQTSNNLDSCWFLTFIGLFDQPILLSFKIKSIPRWKFKVKAEFRKPIFRIMIDGSNAFSEISNHFSHAEKITYWWHHKIWKCAIIRIQLGAITFDKYDWIEMLPCLSKFMNRKIDTLYTNKEKVYHIKLIYQCQI